MAEPEVVIVARMKAKDGMEDAVKNELQALVEATRAESGCIEYRLHQDPKRPANFMIYEQWASSEDLGAHSKSPHFKAFGAKGKELLAEAPDITFWTALP